MNQPTPEPRIRRVSPLLVVLCCLFVAMLAAWYFWITANTSSLRDEIDAWVESGDPLTFADLDRLRGPIDPLTDAGPEYAAAFTAASSVDWGEAQVLLQACERKFPSGANVPRPSVRDASAMVDGAPPDGEPAAVELTVPQLEARLDALLETAQTMTAALDRGAERPVCTLDLNARLGVGGPLSALSTMRVVASLAQLRIYRALLRDDPTAASAATVAALRLPRALEREPVLILHLVATSLRIGVVRLVPLVLQTHPGTADLLRLEAALAETDRPDSFTNAVRVERVQALLLMRQVVAGMLEVDVSAGRPSPQELPVSFLSRIAMRRLCRAYLREFREFLAAAAGKWPAPLKAFQSLKWDSARSGFSLTPMVESGVKHAGNLLTLARCARVAILLERYRNDQREVPGSLADLTRFHGVSLPLDPFSGGELLFRRDKTSYTIYGVGSDERDHGGALLEVGGSGDASDVGLRVETSERP
jgi:hypothetical protein